jgi:site-specific DNA recombinase
MIHKSDIKKAVIYCRVSSQKQLREGDGLESQRARCEEFAKYRGLEVVEIFKDDASGALVNRPAMKAMIAFLKARKDAHIVIIDDISRLARGLEAHLTLRQKIRSAGGILQSPSIDFADDDDSDSSLMEHVLASVSEHARNKIRETTKNRMRGRMLNGYWSFRSPLGYRFKRVPDHGNLMVRDEPVASLIAEMFEGYASGRFQGPAEIMRYVLAHPAWPQERHKTTTVDSIIEILNRIHYAGYIDAPDWGVHMKEGKHEPLVSLATFNKVQARMKMTANAPARPDINQDFPLRGFVECECGQPYTACWSTGRKARHPYYLCQNKSCDQWYGKSIRRDDMEAQFVDLLDALRPSPEFYELARELFFDLWEARRNHSEKGRTQLIAEASRIDKQVTQLVDRIVNSDSETLISAYEERLRRLEVEKAEMRERIANCGRPVTDFATTYRTAMSFLENPRKLWDSDALEDKRAVLKLAFVSRIAYVRGRGFRTAKTSIPFSIFKGLEESDDSDSEMVPLARLERAHLSILDFESSASTNSTTGACEREPLAKLSRPRKPHFFNSRASVFCVALP